MEQECKYDVCNRSGWDSGPWDGEPDACWFIDAATGLPCYLMRNFSGTWCGYVGISPEHKDFNKGCSDVDYDVHGGVTYAGICPVRAVRAFDDQELFSWMWWFGFDCNHSCDFAPAKTSISYVPRGEYRTIDYAKAQCAKLAEQLAQTQSKNE